MKMLESGLRRQRVGIDKSRLTRKDNDKLGMGLGVRVTVRVRVMFRVRAKLRVRVKVRVTAEMRDKTFH